MTESGEKTHKHLDAVKDFILQCISCGDCREATDVTESPPKWGVCVAREHSNGFEPFFGRGKMQIIRSVWEGKLNPSKDLAEIFYQCPTCNACAETCAYDMDNVALYEALRAEIVDAGCGLEGHAAMNQVMVDNLNPYGRDNAQKSEWLKDLGFPVKKAGEDTAEVLYFVGCTAALTEDIRAVAISTANVLHKLGVDFAVLAEEEVCCGSVALRTGFRDAFKSVAEQNLERFAKSGAKTIITSCAGCYRTLKRDYPEFLESFDTEVLHTIEYIHRVLAEKNITLKNLNLNVTYHDPCHTGRHTGVYEEPRAVLSQVATITEMATAKQNAKCCGAGGGVKKAFPELSLEIAKSRVQEAEETGAEYLVSICPFCYRNLTDAIKATGSNLKMVDLLDLINQSLAEK